MDLIQKTLALGNTTANRNASELKIDIGGSQNLNQILGTLTNWIAIIAGIVAFFYLIYSGFLYITAAGNPDQAKKGGQGIINAIIGIIIIALAWGLVTALKGGIS
jgi:hypothetical protein